MNIYKLGLGIILFVFSIGTASCTNVASTDSKSVITKFIEEPLPPLTALKEVRYFRGGWYGPAGMPNWSHDMTFTFNENETVGISAKMPEDEFCGKSGLLSKEDGILFLDKINGLTIGHMEFGAIDGGVSMLVITYNTGEEKTIYLPGSDFIGEDQLYATAGGDALRNHIVEIYGNLATFCE